MRKPAQKQLRPGLRVAQSGAVALIPEGASLPVLRREASHCRACDLWKTATQTVFGEGNVRARVMFVGEQPGDAEDVTGRPFVGPAGKLLDEALRDAGIERSEVYVTNVVKHFKWSPAERGKRRIHKKPRISEIQACRPWLDAELKVVRPEILVCLGATAAQSLLGKDFSVTLQRGQWVRSSLATPCDRDDTPVIHFAGRRQRSTSRPNAGVHSGSEDGIGPSSNPEAACAWQAGNHSREVGVGRVACL